MSKSKTASTMSLRAALVGLARMQIDVNHLLEKADIKRSIVNHSEGRVSLGQLLKFWKEASFVTDDPYIGLHISKLIPFGTYQTHDYLLSNSDNLRKGIKKFIRLFSLINQELAINGVEREDEYEFQIWEHSHTKVSKHQIEYEIGLFYQRLNHVCQDPIEIKEVHFTHLYPKEDILIYENFFNCPVYFEQNKNALIFDKQYLELKCINHALKLSELLKQSAQKLIENLPEFKKHVNPPFLLKFSDALKRELPEGRASIQNMAELFGMSPRTLQRRLKGYNLSYSNILTSIRVELSKEMLTDDSLSLAEIAFLLGFSESSAFHRAFKTWLGQTPMEYRKEVIS